VPIPDLLHRLLRAPGPSGSEEAAAAIVREAAREVGAAVESDALGTTVATVGSGGLLLALVAHVDQIGMGVSGIRDDGLLDLYRLAAWDARVAVAQRVRVLASGGEVAGVVGVRSSVDKPEFADLYLDIGAGSAEEARALVDLGDPIVFDAPPVELAGGRFTSCAIDNRASVYVGLEVLRRLAAEPAACRVALVASVHEEVAGTISAGPPLRALAPDLALALDVTYATDVPEGDPSESGRHGLGGGPAIFRGGVMHPAVVALLRETADAEGIAYSIETGMRSLTDADVVYAEGAAIPTGLVSIPIRRMHTPVESAQLSDLEDAVRLVVAFARRLGPGLDLAR
jgi:endoglucanase